MEHRLLTLAQSEEWRDLLECLPPAQRDIYYTPGYYAADAAGKTAESCCWYCRDGKKLAIYPFQKRPVNPVTSLILADDYYDIEGAYGYNGMICNCEDETFIAGCRAIFEGVCRKERIVAEFTRFHPLLRNRRLFGEHMDTAHLQDTVFIDLTRGYADVWANSYSGKNRNMIRKAKKNGIVCRLSDNLEEFQRLYQSTMDHLGATADYYFPTAYYERLRDEMTPPGKTVLLEAVAGNRIAAALLLLCYGRYAHYHLSARDPEYASLAPVNILLDFAVKQAIAYGAELMHLGGGVGGNDSLMRFKAGFSPLRASFSIGMKIHDSAVYRSLCDDWAARCPEKSEKYRHILLRYRR